jgi:hypothetical protein
MLPKLKKSKLGSLLGVICSIYYPNMTLPCKNSKQKLAGNAARTPVLSSEISVHAQKISSKVLYSENYIFDLSMSK